jgi:hypothetical protein
MKRPELGMEQRIGHEHLLRDRFCRTEGDEARPPSVLKDGQDRKRRGTVVSGGRVRLDVGLTQHVDERSAMGIVSRCVGGRRTQSQRRQRSRGLGCAAARGIPWSSERRDGFNCSRSGAS